MRRPSLPRLLAKWQKILRLQDWTVKANYHGRTIREGFIEWHDSVKEATIRIADPQHYDVDVEEILVHELLHLHFGVFGLANSNSHKTVRGEQAVAAIANALVQLDRKGRKS